MLQSAFKLIIFIAFCALVLNICAMQADIIPWLQFKTVASVVIKTFN